MNITSSNRAVRAVVSQAEAALVDKIEKSSGLTVEEKNKMKEEIRETRIPKPDFSTIPNTPIYLTAVRTLAGCAISIVIGGIILNANNIKTPEYLQVTLATIVGGLAGMMVPTPRIELDEQ